MSRIVIALGGNALGNNHIEQQKSIQKVIEKMMPLIKENHEIIITHGNGPQVGIISLAFEDSYANEAIPIFPLAECTAMSQGYIAYHIEKGLRQKLLEQNINKEVISLITEVEVSEFDESFKEKTKPIGLFYTEEEAKILSEKTPFTYVEDAGRGYRRVVSSPKPKSILNIEVIKKAINENTIIITCGGGGIPVTIGKEITAADAVIDKDLASSLLAKEIKADYLIILTTVDQVCLNYGKENETKLNEVTTEELLRYVNENHFSKGSMLPKIEACIDFVNETGNKAIITSLENISDIFHNKKVTLIKNKNLSN